jgi:chromosome segregation ATPase
MSGFSTPQAAQTFMGRVYEPRFRSSGRSSSCQNDGVAADHAASLLADAAELERRDEAVAGELDAIRSLADRAGAVRARVEEARGALDRLPAEREEVELLSGAAEHDVARARHELELAESRLAALESSRRRRQDELDRARNELATAREARTDAETRIERLAERTAELDAHEEALEGERATLVRVAAEIASELRANGRVTDTAGREPGTTLAELDDWGGRVRSALFVARGTLETEREWIVVEANVLGSTVLGEQLGASSVALVRRRLEERLA